MRLKEKARDKVLGQFFWTMMVITGSVFGVLGGVQASQESGSNKVEMIELFVKSGTAIIRLNENLYPNVKWAVHVVDEADQMKAGLNELIKKVTDEAEARALVQPYFADPAFIERLKRAHLAKLQAKRYGLTRYPAAVINKGEGAVLGRVDMNVIVELVESRN